MSSGASYSTCTFAGTTGSTRGTSLIEARVASPWSTSPPQPTSWRAPRNRWSDEPRSSAPTPSSGTIQLDDTYRLAETLVNDPDDLVDKAVGWMLREAGKRDGPRLASFLDTHAATMPPVMLRYSIEKMDKFERDRFLTMKPLDQ